MGPCYSDMKLCMDGNGWDNKGLYVPHRSPLFPKGGDSDHIKMMCHTHG